MKFFIFISLLLAVINNSFQDDFFKPLFEAFLRDIKRNIFEKPSLKNIPNLPKINSLAGEKRSVYYHEQTVAIIDINNKNQNIYCEIINLKLVFFVTLCHLKNQLKTL